jgi:phosphoglycolate phosphatase
MAKTIIFDFDGTLADSLVVLLEIYNELAVQRSFKAVNQEDWVRLRQGSIADGLRWTGIHPVQVPGMLTAGLRLLKPRTSEIKLFPDMIKVVKDFHDQDIQLFVLSTNAQDVIQEVLNKHGIGDELEVLKSSRVFGKAQAIRKLVKSHNLDPSEVWMIGDEVRDMRAAVRAGVRGIGVSWGFQPPETLQAVDPSVQIAKVAADIPKLVQ